MNPEIAEKIGLDDTTLRGIVADMASAPGLHGRSSEDLVLLLFEVLGMLTGDSSRDEFPRTEADRVVFKIARAHLEPGASMALTQRLAWASLWFSLRPLTAAG